MEYKHSAITMQQFAVSLQRVAGRPVLDRTDLAGLFDIEYAYARDIPAAAAGTPTDLPDLFTALREQLGLKLEPQRNPVDVLVIDSGVRPASN